jgi:hypothetical protein
MLTNKPSKTEQSSKSKSLTEKEWQLHCHAWEKSSLNKAEYCRRHSLNKDNFYYWHHKMLKTQPETTRSNFAQVLPMRNDEAAAMENLTVKINFPNQVYLAITLNEKKLFGLIKELGNAAATIR